MKKRKKYPKILMEITTVTPEKAQSLLGNKALNRKISVHHTTRYADAMNKDLWQFDGMPIRIDWFGQMLDGQQRCLSIIKSGKPQKILIIYGLDPNTIKIMDSGKVRSLADNLMIAGEQYYNALASALQLYVCYKAKKRLSGGLLNRTGLQTEEMFDVLFNNPSLRISVKYARAAKPILSIAIGTFLHYIFSKKNKEQANEFFEKLISGEGFVKKDPIRVLRDKLLFNKTEAIKMEREYKIAITIKAWNAFRDNGQMTKLTWRGSRKSDEPMPEVK